MAHHSIRDVLVTGYEHFIDGLVLPDPDDRHILAAAVHVGAQAIVTCNLRDFPASVLEPMGVMAVHPDAFVVELIEAAPDAIAEVVIAQARALRSPATSVSDLLATLAGQGLEDSVTKLSAILGVPSQTVSR